MKLITILIVALFLTSCNIPPRIAGTYNTNLNLTINDTNKLTSDDALTIIMLDYLSDGQDIQTTFAKKRIGYSAVKSFEDIDTLYFEWDYYHSEQIKVTLKDSTVLILHYNQKCEYWQSAYDVDSIFTLSLTFTQI